MSEVIVSSDHKEFKAPNTGVLSRKDSDKIGHSSESDLNLQFTKIKNGEISIFEPSSLQLLREYIVTDYTHSTVDEKTNLWTALDLLQGAITSPKTTTEQRKITLGILENGLNSSNVYECLNKITRLAQGSTEIVDKVYVEEVIKPARAIFEGEVSRSVPTASIYLIRLMRHYSSSNEWKSWIVNLTNKSLNEWAEKKKTVNSWSEEDLKAVAYALELDSLRSNGTAAWFSFLKTANLDYIKLANAWVHADYYAWAEMNGETRQNFTANAEASMLVIRQIESIRPGASRVLNELFGLTIFGRYPAEALIRQYDERNNTDSSYAVVVLPIADHSGAFFQDKRHLEKVYSELKEHNVLTRFIEAENVVRLYVQLERLDARYNTESNNKILGGLIGGHGNTDRIQFGFGGPQGIGSLKLSDFRADRDPGFPDRSARMLEFAKRVKTFFIDHPSVGFLSCSTGVENGISQEISKFYNAKVVAPAEDTAIEDISVSWIDDDRPTFHVKYDTGDSTAYLGGKSVEIEKL